MSKPFLTNDTDRMNTVFDELEPFESAGLKDPEKLKIVNDLRTGKISVDSFPEGINKIAALKSLLGPVPSEKENNFAEVTAEGMKQAGEIIDQISNLFFPSVSKAEVNKEAGDKEEDYGVLKFVANNYASDGGIIRAARGIMSLFGDDFGGKLDDVEAGESFFYSGKKFDEKDVAVIIKSEIALAKIEDNYFQKSPFKSKISDTQKLEIINSLRNGSFDGSLIPSGIDKAAALEILSKNKGEICDLVQDLVTPVRENSILSKDSASSEEKLTKNTNKKNAKVKLELEKLFSDKEIEFAFSQEENVRNKQKLNIIEAVRGDILDGTPNNINTALAEAGVSTGAKKAIALKKLQEHLSTIRGELPSENFYGFADVKVELDSGNHKLAADQLKSLVLIEEFFAKYLSGISSDGKEQVLNEFRKNPLGYIAEGLESRISEDLFIAMRGKLPVGTIGIAKQMPQVDKDSEDSKKVFKKFYDTVLKKNTLKESPLLKSAPILLSKFEREEISKLLRDPSLSLKEVLKYCESNPLEVTNFTKLDAARAFRGFSKIVESERTGLITSKSSTGLETPTQRKEIANEFKAFAILNEAFSDPGLFKKIITEPEKLAILTALRAEPFNLATLNDAITPAIAKNDAQVRAKILTSLADSIEFARCKLPGLPVGTFLFGGAADELAAEIGDEAQRQELAKQFKAVAKLNEIFANPDFFNQEKLDDAAKFRILELLRSNNANTDIQNELNKYLLSSDSVQSRVLSEFPELVETLRGPLFTGIFGRPALDEVKESLDEKQKAVLEEIKLSEEKQKAALEEMKLSEEKQKAVLEEIESSEEKQKAALEEMKSSEEKQKAVLEEMKSSEEKQKAAKKLKAITKIKVAAAEELETTTNKKAAAAKELETTTNKKAAAAKELETTTNKKAAAAKEPKIIADKKAAKALVITAKKMSILLNTNSSADKKLEQLSKIEEEEHSSENFEKNLFEKALDNKSIEESLKNNLDLQLLWSTLEGDEEEEMRNICLESESLIRSAISSSCGFIARTSVAESEALLKAKNEDLVSSEELKESFNSVFKGGKLEKLKDPSIIANVQALSPISGVVSKEEDKNGLVSKVYSGWDGLNKLTEQANSAKIATGKPQFSIACIKAITEGDKTRDLNCLVYSSNGNIVRNFVSDDVLKTEVQDVWDDKNKIFNDRKDLNNESLAKRAFGGQIEKKIADAGSKMLKAELTGNEKGLIAEKFAGIFTSKTDKENLKNLLDCESPTSAFKGIAISKDPKNKDTTLVTYRGNEGDSIAYLHLPGTNNMVVRCVRCDGKPVTVYESGKQIEKEGKKGQLFFDVDTVFYHDTKAGTYESFNSNGRFIGTSELNKGFGESEANRIRGAYKNFKVKAVSINDKEERNISIFHDGKQYSEYLGKEAGVDSVGNPGTSITGQTAEPLKSSVHTAMR